MPEIQSSRLATNQADDATNAIAQHIITDHQKTISEAMSMMNAGMNTGDVKTTLPTGMNCSQQAMPGMIYGLHGV